jgi:hypothetical protein
VFYRYLVWFAAEFGWTPATIRELRYCEFLGFIRHFDQVEAHRREASR